MRRAEIGVVLSLWFAAIVTAGVSCSSNPSGRGGASTVTVAYWEGKQAFSPSSGEMGMHLVYLPLMALDRDGQWRGRLARSWEASADGKEWTYHLRADVRWHDGVPVTAHDVAFTIDLMRTIGDMDGDGYSGSGAIESVTVHDDSTITIRQGHGRLSYHEWFMPFPRHLLDGLDRQGFEDWDFWTHPVGNGPYRFVRYEPMLLLMEFEANPDFYLGRPRIERVILKFSLPAGLTDLLAGTVDAVPDFPVKNLLVVRDDPRFRVYHWIGAHGGRAIYWNPYHPLFEDPSIRRALTYAIDRRELHRVLNYPDSLPIVDGLITPDQFRRGEFEPELPHDPDAAIGLFEAAGWRDTDSDGIRDRDGRPFSFTAKVGPSSLTDAVLVQSQLRRIGIHMEIQTGVGFGWGTLETGDYEAYFFPIRFYEPLWLGNFRDQPGYYRTPRFIELLDRVDATLASAAVDSLYREMSSIFRRDLPLTFLYPFVRFTVVNRRLRGLSSPFLAIDPVAYMDELWLED